MWKGHSGLGWYPVEVLELDREWRTEILENWFRVGEGAGDEVVVEDESPRLSEDFNRLIDLLGGGPETLTVDA